MQREVRALDQLGENMTFDEWVARTVPMNGAEYALVKAAWKASAESEREACAEYLEQQHTWISNVAAANLVRERPNKE